MLETSTEPARGTATVPARAARPRRRPGLRRVGRGLLLVLALLSVAGLAGAGAEGGIARSDAEGYPPVGRLVTMGGNDLHLNCTGSGAPTVVLEAGLGEPSLSCADVQSSLYDGLRVCSYNRAVLGCHGNAGDVH